MRILVIHTSYKFKGGEDSVVANEMALLQSVGAEIELMQFSNAGSTLKKILQIAFNYSSYIRTIKKIKFFKPDVVHVHNLHFGGSYSVMYAIKTCNIPFVVTLHNYRMLCPSATLFFNGTNFTDALNKSFSWKAILKGVYKNSKILTFWISCSMFIHEKLKTHHLPDKYIALGAYTKEIFKSSKLKSLANDIVVKPNFCYSDAGFNEIVGDYYLYVGRLSEEKGMKTLLTAFSKNGLPLKIAGTGPMVDEVIAYSHKFPNIEYLHSVENNRVSALLDRAIALIFPSIWFETFGMVVIEAFSRSVPVIASNLGQLKFTIQNNTNGLLFLAGDAMDLNKKVTYFQNLSQEDNLRFRKCAFDSYNEFYTPQKNASQLINIYNEAILHRGR